MRLSADACSSTTSVSQCEGKSHMWPDDEDELLLTVTLECKVNKTQENALRLNVVGEQMRIYPDTRAEIPARKVQTSAALVQKLRF